MFVKIGGDEDLMRKWEGIIEFLREHQITHVAFEIKFQSN